MRGLLPLLSVCIAAAARVRRADVAHEVESEEEEAAQDEESVPDALDERVPLSSAHRQVLQLLVDGGKMSSRLVFSLNLTRLILSITDVCVIYTYFLDAYRFGHA